MTVSYKVRKITNKRLQDKPFFAISLVTGENITLDELAERMSIMSSFSPGDVTGLIINLADMIAKDLAGGCTVTLDGLGTFSLSAALVNPVDDPEKITGNNIRLRKVCFKPSPHFKQKIEDRIGFERLSPKFDRKR